MEKKNKSGSLLSQFNWPRVLAIAIGITIATNITSRQWYIPGDLQNAAGYIIGQFLTSLVIAAIIELIIVKLKK